MSGAEAGLVLSVFLACTVEAVEALTIVLAVGTTRSWPSAMTGVFAATLALTALVAALGPALTSLPIGVLRVIVGGLLLVFGLQWLRKAILRSAGLKAKHDELQVFGQETKAAGAAGARHAGLDGYAFTIAFKGVLLEGLEVVFIVLTFGANQHRIPLAAAAAGLAVLAVTAAGAGARAPLARVPENTMKFTVGVMLTSFGTFWGAEGAGASWPGDDAALLAIVAGVLIVAVAIARTLRRAAPPSTNGASPGTTHASHSPDNREPMTRIRVLLLAVWGFVAGDDWRTAAGVVLALALTAIVAAVGASAWWVMPLAVLGLLALSIRRVARSDSH